jgi:hypothetical protein
MKEISQNVNEYKSIQIKSGHEFLLSYHYELINELLNKNLSGWGKCTYKINPYLIMWIIQLDGKESRDGWTNVLENENCIREIYTGDKKKFILDHKFSKTKGKLRAVFDYDKKSKERKYIFRGIFKEEPDNDDFQRGWIKVSDSFELM